MLKNYIKIAWRNLYKNKVFSLIHILGLTIGITVCVMIFVYVLNEFSYDSFHKNGKNIYRIMRGYDPAKPRAPYMSGPYGNALRNDYANQIQDLVAILPSNDLITFGEKSFTERNIFYADADFFKMFSFQLIKGNALTALKEPKSIVLTESTAKKYFGNADPMGKVVKVDKQYQYKVTGIAKDVPSNSHLYFDVIMPLSNFYHEPFFNVWANNNSYIYMQLKPGVKPEQLERTFPAFMQKYMRKDMEHMRVNFDLALTPLKDIYFEQGVVFDGVKHGDKKVVYIFISVAVLIMLIACINFLNLSTIRAAERSKEVGLRKVLGALRNHLMMQFIGESILLTLISCVLAIGLLFLLMPWYNSILGYELTVQWTSAPIYLFLLSLVLIVGFVSGGYPALFISAFSPIQALKGKLKFGKGASFFRQSLVVVQFSISVMLIIGTIVIMKQMSYVKNKSLGYDKDQLVTVRIDNDEIYNHRRLFQSVLENNGNIESVSLMAGEPGGFYDTNGFEVEDKPATWRARTSYTDAEYLKTLGLKVIAGRGFSRQFATDSAEAAIINRTAAKDLGFTPDQAVGKWIKNTYRDSVRRHIVGVVEDFNYLSLKQTLDPLVITQAEDSRVAVIKIKAGNIKAGMEAIKQAYAQVAPVYPFEYSFLNQQFDKAYRSDIRQQTILSAFAGVAIFIACLGLFGLASFSAAKRTKEIGVRKVLGSSVQNIIILLSKDILKPVLIATIIAMPVGYFLMNKWLQNFAYRISMQWWIFVLAAVLTTLIAVLTISYNALRAALANPVKSLRNE